MNFLRNMFSQWVDPDPIQDADFLDEIRKEKLYIADIGATQGPERKWACIAPCTHFYSFDPSPQFVPAKTGWEGTLFPIGLWSEKAEKPFYLMQNPQASSLYQFHENIKAFGNRSGHVCVKATSVKLDTLDHVLKEAPPPDFLKIDAEGADLEILKGSHGFLASSVLGVQVESPFIERHEKAPLFGEIDAYLRKFGFELFDFTPERWLRHNGHFSSLSKPQVIWADCVYLLGKKVFLRQIEPLNYECKKKRIFKYITLLLVYRLHDAAQEIVHELKHLGWLETAELDRLETLIAKTLKQSKRRFLKLAFSLAATTTLLLFTAPFPRMRKTAFHYHKGVLRALSQWLQSKTLEDGVIR